MTLTLLEYAKTVPDQKQRAVIELFPDAVDFMGAIPTMTAPGGAFRYQEEGALPDNIAFRAINETPTTGYGNLNDKVEQTFPLAGNLDVDRVLLNRLGMEHRSIQENLRIKALAKKWADTFMTGDNVTSPREWTGMKARLKAVGGSVDGTNYRSRIFANSASSGGGALSLAQLDRAIGLVERPNALIMPKALKDRFAAAQRDTQIGGFISLDKDEMGKPITRYNDLPIYTGYGVTALGEFMPFNEVGAGGGAAVTSSIYIMSFSNDGVCIIETKPMEVTDIGLMQDGVFYRTNVEWDHGLANLGGFSALRMTSVTNAPIVK